MGLREQQDLLARLYTDALLRREFYEKPLSVGAKFGLKAAEINGLATVAREEVGSFADSLVAKRFHEVQNLLPLSRKVFEADLRRRFMEFAADFNPTGVKKHYEDALEFCRVLSKQSDLSPVQLDTVNFERTRLRFSNEDSRLAWCRVKSRLRTSDHPAAIRRKLLGLAIWIRLADRTVHFTL